MSIPKEIFELPMNDYIRARYDRFIKVPFMDAWAEKADDKRWLVLNYLWRVQYYGVELGLFDPEKLRD